MMQLLEISQRLSLYFTMKYVFVPGVFYSEITNQLSNVKTANNIWKLMDCTLLHHLMQPHLHGCKQSGPPCIKLYLHLPVKT